MRILLSLGPNEFLFLRGGVSIFFLSIFPDKISKNFFFRFNSGEMRAPN